MPTAVIEIDVTVESTPTTPRRSRSPAVALVVAGLVLVLTGPALVRPTYLPPLWQMPTTSRYFWLTADTFYTIDVGQGVWLRARDPGSGRSRWAVRC